jgi:hypothetical protein
MQVVNEGLGLSPNRQGASSTCGGAPSKESAFGQAHRKVSRKNCESGKGWPFRMADHHARQEKEAQFMQKSCA